VPVYSAGTQTPAPTIAKDALKLAREKAYTVLIVDTAGRLQIDSGLMQELEQVRMVVRPSEILLVVDAMTGQEAVNVAEGFDTRVPLTGLIMTKIDGDARGGAALSVRQVTGCRSSSWAPAKNCRIWKRLSRSVWLGEFWGWGMC
jgi:signal recognition particle subunit SRP54